MRREAAALLLLLGGAAAQGTPTSTAADAMARSLGAAFTSCGASPRLSGPLSLAAVDLLRGYDRDAALKRQRYRPHDAYSFSATYQGDVAWVKAQVAQMCGKLVGLKEYGLALDGTRLSVILATEARVDLTVTSRWMAEFLAATNRARFQGQKCGGELMNAVPPLRWDDRLASAAQRHAADMVRLNFRGHVNPTDGSKAQQRAAALGFVGVAGENIAYGPISAQEAVTQLLTSPEHCKNLMDPHWTLFDGGVTNGTPDTIFATYWVQVFGAAR